MHARSLVAATAILVLSCGVAGARDLTVVARLHTQEAIKQVFVRPFTAATAIPVQMEVWEGGIDALRTQAKAPDNTWDLVMVDSDELATGCSEGLFEKLDWSAIGGKDHYLPQAVSDCGVGGGVASLGAGLGPRQVSGNARLVGFLGRREVSRQARPARRRARQPGIRADRRWRLARRCLQGARHVRGRRSRVPPARSAQALHRVVARRRRGGADTGIRRRADDQRLRAGHHRGEPDRASQLRRAMGGEPVRGSRAGRSSRAARTCGPRRSSSTSRERRPSRRGWSRCPARAAWRRVPTTACPPNLRRSRRRRRPI